MIGILTFWGVPNYGAFCQAYALNKAVRTMLGDKEDVVHIGYLHPKHVALYRDNKKPVINRLKSLLSPNYYLAACKYLFGCKNTYPKFDKAWDQIPNIKFNKVDELEKYHFNKVILGSDSIWEYSTNDFGNDKHLIGLGLNAEKIYSYAPSFGDMTVNDFFPAFIKGGLHGINKITVRDKSSADIVKKFLNGSTPDMVLDPTFLCDFISDTNVICPPTKDYILVYGTNFDENVIKDIRRYAKKENLRIIGAGLAPKWCDNIFEDLSPFEWIGFFKNARFIVTCTFHGLMFSIHFRKRVLFQQVAHVKNRSQWLLDLTGLSELNTKSPRLAEMLNYKWNYDEIYMLINNEKIKSINLLKDMLIEH